MSGMEGLELERLPHWPFVLGAYAAFFLLIIADALQPWIAARRLRRELAARAAREDRRPSPGRD